MSSRTLFGPVDAEYSRRYLNSLRASGEVRTFGYSKSDGIDVVIAPGDPWEAVAAKLPEGWSPDFVALYLPYTALPAFVAEVPVPVVGLAADWNLLWDCYAKTLPLCDLVLTDAPGVEALRRHGLPGVEQAVLFGGPETWTPADPAGERDIDLLFVGNTQHAVTRQRLPLLGVVARLAERFKVVIDRNVSFEDYRSLLLRSRLVFNPSARREWNQRVCESVLCGAALAVDADNAEVLDVLRPGVECVTFTPQTIESALGEILSDEPRRLELARSAQQRLGDATFARFWREAVGRVESSLDELRMVRSARGTIQPKVVRAARIAAHLCAPIGDSGLFDEVLATVNPQTLGVSETTDLAWLHAGVPADPALGLPAGIEQAITILLRLFRRNPRQPVVACNVVRVLIAINRLDRLPELVQRVRGILDAASLEDASSWEPALWQGIYDEVRVEWQRAGWENAGNPIATRAARREVLRWFLQMVSGDLDREGGVVPYYEAVRARPDLPRGRAALGCALARTGHKDQAVEHLRAAITGNPFDRRAAAALAQVLADLKRVEELQTFQAGQRLLHRAAPRLVPEADWFAQGWPQPAPNHTANGVVSPPQRARADLVSIVICCHNQVRYTKSCLESVVRFTRKPYELILVDNASTDGTPAFLEEFKKRPGPQRVEVLTQATNLGFGGGCNAGIAATSGTDVVLLNNDTLVTPRWLEGMTAARHRGNNVGLVGAVSNAATPEQTVEVPYKDVGQMLEFAKEWRERHLGQIAQLDRLSGFCLLVRREVLERVGTFDERFGLGFFEDDDLCLRARQARYSLAVALEVFVHHYGSQTVTELGIDSQGLLRENLGKFIEKWGEKTPEGYRTARIAPLGTTADRQGASDSLFTGLQREAETRRDEALTNLVVDVSATGLVTGNERLPAMLRPAARVSLCVIAKDEEENIADCIGPVKHLFHEVVVNDTGSRDKTIAIAKSLGAKVVEYAWQNSFCQARNQSIEAATGDWIFWLDADDRVDADNVRKLQRVFASLEGEPRGYALTCRCLGAEGDHTDVTHVRLFPRRDDLRWSHRIHEQIVPALRAIGADVLFTDVVVHHVGYTDPALRQKKLDRDLHLLRLERKEIGDHPFTMFNLGCIYLERGNYIEAFPYFQSSLDRSHKGDSIVRKLYAQMARCQWGLDQRESALWHCNEGLKYYGKDEELLFLTGQYHQEMGNLEPARAMYLRLLDGPREGAHFSSTATGLRGFRAMHNLALAFQGLGDLERAEHWFDRAVQDHPGFVPGWQCLAEVLIARGKRTEAAAIADRLESLGKPHEARRIRDRLATP